MSDALLEKAQALELARNEAFQRFVEATRADLVTQWKAARTTEARETVWYTLEGLNALLKHLRVVVARGKKLELDTERTAARSRQQAVGADRDRS